MQIKRVFPFLFLLLLISALSFQAVLAITPDSSNTSIKFVQSTPEPSQPIGQPSHGTPPLSLTLFLGCLCVILFLIVGVIVLGIFVRRDNGKTMKKDSAKE